MKWSVSIFLILYSYVAFDKYPIFICPANEFRQSCTGFHLRRHARWCRRCIRQSRRMSPLSIGFQSTVVARHENLSPKAVSFLYRLVRDCFWFFFRVRDSFRQIPRLRRDSVWSRNVRWKSSSPKRAVVPLTQDEFCFRFMISLRQQFQLPTLSTYSSIK